MLAAELGNKKNATFPNFLILGAAKSATTSLFVYLAQHPQIFMSRSKEPEFFVWAGREVNIRGPRADRIRKRIVTDAERYKELFEGAINETALGEASTAYLYTPETAIRIREHIPEAKLIAILRNPIDRAYSAFLHARRDGYEPLADFGEALEAEPARIRDHWGGLTHYTRVSRYAEQLDRYTALFPTHQLRIYLYEDMVSDPLAVARDVFQFLRVDPTFEPRVIGKRNEAVLVRSPRAHALMTSKRARSMVRVFLPKRLRPSLYFSLRNRNQLRIDSIDPEERTKLARVFESEIRMLSRKLGRDLSPWLEDKMVSPPEQGLPVGMQPVDEVPKA